MSQKVPIWCILLEHFIVSVLNILSQKTVLSVILMQNIKLRDSSGSQAVLERVQALLSLVEASQEDLAGHLNLDQGLQHGTLLDQLI